MDIELPDNYRLSFRVRGDTAPNTLEIKFIDPSGENVWWVRRVAWEFPREWAEVVADKRNMSSWGPSANHVLTKIGAIEVTVTAAAGGNVRPLPRKLPSHPPHRRTVSPEADR